MNENPFDGEKKTADAEAAQVKTVRYGEGVAKGWENERQFTVKEIIAALKEVGENAGDLKVTEEYLSFEGVLVTVVLRAKGSAVGYTYTLKGNYGQGNFNKETMIEKVDFMGPDSEDVEMGFQIAAYKDGNWVKK